MKDLESEIKENELLRKKWWELVCKYEEKIDESEMLSEIVTIGNSLMTSSFRVCYLSSEGKNNGNDKPHN